MRVASFTLVLCGVLLPLSFDAFLVSLVALTTDRFKLGLQLRRGPQQLVVLALHLLGLLLVLVSALDEGQ
jgi:hypothetical protein